MSDVAPQKLFEKDIREMCFVLIENNPVLRRTMIRTLKKAGITKFVEAGSGKEGTMMLKVSRVVDVIIFSDHLPDLDSRKYLQIFSQNKKYESTTIILISSNNDTASIQKAIAHGADGYIVKPFPFNDAPVNIEEAIQNRRRRLALKDLRVKLEVPIILTVKKDQTQGMCVELARNGCQVIVEKDPGIGTRLQLQLPKMKEESAGWYEPISCTIASAARVSDGYLLKMPFSHKPAKSQGILSLLKQYGQQS